LFSEKYSYIEGWKAIEIANDAFGPNGWSCEIIDLCTDFCESVNDKWTIGVSALVRVTLKDGCFHEDLGFGSAENMKGKHNAMEKAKKEAVTDARKRVLRLFGNGVFASRQPLKVSILVSLVALISRTRQLDRRQGAYCECSEEQESEKQRTITSLCACHHYNNDHHNFSTLADCQQRCQEF
jgi:recombination DNA repair RAD52 pathway protein